MPVLMAQTFVNSTNYCFQHNMLVVVNVVWLCAYLVVLIDLLSCLTLCTESICLLYWQFYGFHVLSETDI